MYIKFIDLLDFWNLISILISLFSLCKSEHERFLRCLITRSKQGEKQSDNVLAWRNVSERSLLTTVFHMTFDWEEFSFPSSLGPDDCTGHSCFSVSLHGRRWGHLCRRNQTQLQLCISGLFASSCSCLAWWAKNCQRMPTSSSFLGSSMFGFWCPCPWHSSVLDAGAVDEILTLQRCWSCLWFIDIYSGFCTEFEIKCLQSFYQESWSNTWSLPFCNSGENTWEHCQKQNEQWWRLATHELSGEVEPKRQWRSLWKCRS